MNKNTKNIVIISWIIIVVIAIIFGYFLSKNDYSIVKQPYSDEKTQIVSREFDDNWDMNHIMQYDCSTLQEEDAKQYCSSKQQKLYDFYATMSWDIIQPQLTQQQLEGFYCEVLVSPEDKKCKDAIFLHMGQK